MRAATEPNTAQRRPLFGSHGSVGLLALTVSPEGRAYRKKAARRCFRLGGMCCVFSLTYLFPASDEISLFPTS